MPTPPGRRRKFAALPALLVLAACAGPRLEFAAAPSQASLTLTDASIRLTVLPNTWSGYPSDLRRYYTPVEIHIQNDRADEIQVRYGDFLAVDEARNQYRAVPPAEVVRALFGARDGDRRSRHAMRPRRPALVAWYGPGWPYPYWPYRPWYPFAPYPYYPDPFYYDYPYPYPRATGYDILTLGLREGRVLPGARVQGFLYFQQATRQGNALTLTWVPASAEGKPLAAFSSQFRIVR